MFVAVSVDLSDVADSGFTRVRRHTEPGIAVATPSV